MLATKPGMLPDFNLLRLFNLMALFVHVSCCASNDLIDLDYERKGERGKTRPLAAGDIIPLQGRLFWALNIALLIPVVLKLNKLWGVTLATPPGMFPDFKLIGLFYLIGFFEHVSCCASNDLIDFKYDRKVERCKTRPLAAGTITPFQGWLFWGLINALLVPLVLKLNKLSIALSAVEQVLWIGYPFLKRITYWPATYLGVVHNWGVLLGYAAVKGHLKDWRIFLPVHIAGICWTLIYDTIYAHQDKNDDVKAGVKSTAVLFGDSTKNWLLGFATIIIGGLLLGGYNARMGWPFYLSMIPAAGHLLWQIFSTDYSNKFDCFMKLISNKWFGAIIFVGMLLGRVYY